MIAHARILAMNAVAAARVQAVSFLLLLPLALCFSSFPQNHINSSTTTAMVTVSGISGGGFMSVQFHVAHSSIVAGAGVVAGGPYYCAWGNLVTAETSCMRTPSLIDVEALVKVTQNTALTGTIDSLAHLEDDRVFLFSGTLDTVVAPKVVSKLEEYYGRFLRQPGAIATEFGIPAEHAFVTESYGNQCSYKGEPYINQCQYDTAGSILQHLYAGQLQAPNGTSVGAVEQFQQGRFVPLGYTLITAALEDHGYRYVPKVCQSNIHLTPGAAAPCRLHVVFHGCLQDSDVVQERFVSRVGYNEWAEANGIVILYPQARKTLLNPKGCWDWWGYTGIDYASKLGAQMQAVKGMVDYTRNRYHFKPSEGARA